MIAIIDYGLSNLLSIQRAVLLFEKEVVVTNSFQDIYDAEKLILPGVGAFHYGMNCLHQLNLTDVITERAKSGVPLLGICLGMQMLFQDSEEGGLYSGLGLIEGHVEEIPRETIETKPQNVPHIGWNTLHKQTNHKEWPDILNNIDMNYEVYFVHSFEGKPKKEENNIAYTTYGGREICAIVQDENVVGCQFHPEKSGNAGLQILKNFITLF